MRRVIFEEKGGPEVLKFETLDLPSPATGEVRIKIKAIGLNRYESMFRQGVYVVPPELPSAIVDPGKADERHCLSQAVHEYHRLDAA